MLLWVTDCAVETLGRSASPAHARASAIVVRIGPPAAAANVRDERSDFLTSVLRRCSAWRRTWGDAGKPCHRRTRAPCANRPNEPRPAEHEACPLGHSSGTR